MRKILLYTVKKPIIPENLKQNLNARNTVIENILIADTDIERLELYGYDGTLKYKTKNISSRTKLFNALKTCIARIDKMPMGSIEKTIRKGISPLHQSLRDFRTRKRLLAKCGLPDVAETQHCFSDSTHHTCCMLGSKSREYADSSGNPIGSLSVKVQTMRKRKSKINTNINTNTNKGLTPWCTCTGSKVCSYYKGKFGKEDGTHIKFIGTGKNNAGNDAKNENKAISAMRLSRHRTPGIVLKN